MNRFFWQFCVGLIFISQSLLVYSQGDLAISDTFSRYSPAVFTLSVEIPKDVILQRYEGLLQQLKQSQEVFADLISKATGTISTTNAFENYLSDIQKQMSMINKEGQQQMPFVSGVGFAVDPHYMVTLSTVIRNATQGAEIVFMDNYKRTFKAHVQGVDGLSGIAVLRVDDVTFPNYVDIARISAPLPETSFVLSIQCPYGLPASPYHGMIGGYYRRTKRFQLENYIQSSIQLYPGNEGAPVFSATGQLVGMIADRFQMEGYPSVTFLIPADMIVDSAKQIMQRGKRERGCISGLTIRQDKDGVQVYDVTANSVAAAAGLLRNDFIIGFQGKDVINVWQFQNEVFNTHPNETVRLQILRGNKTQWIEIKTALYDYISTGDMKSEPQK